MWDIEMRYYQRKAADRLFRWIPDPVVTMALVLRSMEDDFDCVDDDIRRKLQSLLPAVANPLLFARTCDPDDPDADDLICDLLGWYGGKEESDGVDLALAAHRARLFLQKPSKGFDPAFVAELEEFFEKRSEDLAAMGTSPLVRDSELVVTALLGAKREEQLQACHTLIGKNRLLGICALALVYLGPRYEVFKGEAMKAVMGTIPAPPIALGNNAVVRVPATSQRGKDAGELLEALAPVVKAWLDVALPSQLFHQEDGADLWSAIQRLRVSEPKLQRVYASLGLSCH